MNPGVVLVDASTLAFVVVDPVVVTAAVVEFPVAVVELPVAVVSVAVVDATPLSGFTVELSVVVVTLPPPQPPPPPHTQTQHHHNTQYTKTAKL